MRLASLREGRDGRLVAVSEDLRLCVEAPVRTLQAALDDWTRWEPDLRALVPCEPFDAELCAAPLPRAYQWLDGSAYLNHVRLARQARGAPLPRGIETDPLMYQGLSDGNLGPREPIQTAPGWHADFEGEVAVITGDVPRGAGRETALAAIHLVTLVNDISLRGLIPDELAKGLGFVQSKPASAYAPLAVTPDALPGWDDGRLSGTLEVDLNGEPFGRAETGEGMAFDFPTLVMHAARTRPLSAGTVIGSGTVSNGGADGPGCPVAEGGRGYSCIAEARMVETIRRGMPATHWLASGDRVRISMSHGGPNGGRSLFGDIDQTVIEQAGIEQAVSDRIGIEGG